MSEIGYSALMDRIAREGFGNWGSDISVTWAIEAWEHPDFDIPGVIATTAGSRVVLIVEGERKLVGPLIEAAYEAVGRAGEPDGREHELRRRRAR